MSGRSRRPGPVRPVGEGGASRRLRRRAGREAEATSKFEQMRERRRVAMAEAKARAEFERRASAYLEDLAELRGAAQ